MVGQRTQPASQAQLNAAARAILGGAGVQDGPLRGLSMEDFDRATDLANQMKAGAMDEDLETEEQSAEMPIEGTDLQALVGANPALAAYMRKYEADIAAADAARQKQAKTYKDVFEKGEKEILARRYGAPTTSEQLFALGSALLAPRRYKGFAGTLDKITPVFGKMEQLERSAEAQRAEALEKLRREYLTGVADADVSAAQAQLEARGRLLSPLASATKPRSRRRALGEGNRVYDLDTGEEIVPLSYKLAQIPPQAIEALRAQMADPSVPSAVKIQSRRSFETTYGVPVADALGGQ